MSYANEYLAKERHDDLMHAAAQSRLAAQVQRPRDAHPHSAGEGGSADGLSTVWTPRTTIPRIRRWAVALAAAVLTLLAGAPAALARPIPPPGGSVGAQVVQYPALHAAAGGTPGWQIVLIAIGSALVASALTILAVRLTRRVTPVRPSLS